MKSFVAWLDQRTGLVTTAREVLSANVPGGSSWGRVWGGTVLFCLAVQFMTGVFLWIDYSPGAQTAWESVNYIQTQMSGGWLVRGLHHYNAQILPVLLALHVMQLIVSGAYRAPREVNFWLTLLLTGLIMAMALTGYQLPWDQKGFWATKVGVNIMGIAPVAGPAMQRILIGGPEYGHLTLTRFFALHAGVLPVTALIVLAVYFCVWRRHGFAGREISPTTSRIEPLNQRGNSRGAALDSHAPSEGERAGVRGPVHGKGDQKSGAPLWPDQALKTSAVCLAVMATLLYLILRHQASATPGAELGAPADPAEPYSAARPEWYFLFLYQFLKLFPSGTEIVGAIIIPTIVAGIVFIMPFTGRGKAGHRFNLGFLACVLLGIGWLTYSALSTDAHDEGYQLAVKNAHREADRIRELAAAPAGIPTSGAISLVRTDPFIQGPKLFARNCAACHRFEGGDGLGGKPNTPQSASDLAGFGSREWIAGLLDPARVAGVNYFGATKLKSGKMVKFVTRDVANYTPEQREQLQPVIAAVSAEAGLKAQAGADRRDAAMIATGRKLLADAMKCTDCHAFRAPDADASGPDLTGYGSREWLVKFLANPGHSDFYGERNDRMPAFGEKQLLTPVEIGMLADWLRGEWYRPETAKQMSIRE